MARSLVKNWQITIKTSAAKYETKWEEFSIPKTNLRYRGPQVRFWGAAVDEKHSEISSCAVECNTPFWLQNFSMFSSKNRNTSNRYMRIDYYRLFSTNFLSSCLRFGVKSMEWNRLWISIRAQGRGGGMSGADGSCWSNLVSDKGAVQRMYGVCN